MFYDRVRLRLEREYWFRYRAVSSGVSLNPVGGSMLRKRVNDPSRIPLRIIQIRKCRIWTLQFSKLMLVQQVLWVWLSISIIYGPHSAHVDAKRRPWSLRNIQDQKKKENSIKICIIEISSRSNGSSSIRYQSESSELLTMQWHLWLRAPAMRNPRFVNGIAINFDLLTQSSSSS